MTDELDDHDAIAALLARPEVWDDVAHDAEDAIVAAIAAEPPSHATSTGDVTNAAPNVVPIRRLRRWAMPFAAGVAAATVLVGAFALVTRSSDPDGIELAMAGTELAPEANASALIDTTPLGTRIILDVAGLPPAQPGTYYEAWLRVDGEIGVSAGTFHLRGGDGNGEIELWAGVPIDDYPLVTVTIQAEAQAESSGVVVLKGRIGP
jgi:hypothetical protein